VALLALAAIAAALLRPSSGVLTPVTDTQMLGQRIMVGLPGRTADAGLLAEVRGGQVGAVVLYAYNVVSRQQVQALTGTLQHAARAGGNPPLLIAIDQEGGQVKRFPNAPPFVPPPQMGSTAFREGQLTGRYLKARGINMDLAPVADVPTSASSFMWQEGRTFSFNPGVVAQEATAFARGLQSAGVAAAAKHFPGIGSAQTNTDNKLDELHTTSAQRTASLRPYEQLIPSGVDSIVVSTAGFPAYDPSGAPAALSRPVIAGLLRGRLGFGGVAVTDSLWSPTGHDALTAGVLAARAGADILLYRDSASGELSALEAALRSGRISRADALASYERIVALKAKLGD
jgi:beta-N-acetylhexosaminidase